MNSFRVPEDDSTRQRQLTQGGLRRIMETIVRGPDDFGYPASLADTGSPDRGGSEAQLAGTR